MSMLATNGVSQAQGVPMEVQEALRRARIPQDAIGIYVQEVGSRFPWAAVNPRKAFNPASTMKLLTTGVALDLLGPTFSWRTAAYVSGEPRGEVLHGDLILKGSGDPKLLAEHLWQFLRQIRARGIREIRGDLVLDRGAFDGAPFDAAAFDGAPEKAYNAGPDALLLNHKAIRLQFLPDEGGGAVRVGIDPPMAGIALSPPALTHGECGDWREKLGVNIDASRIDITGSYDAQCGEKTWFVHAYQMSANQYFEAAFRQVWREVGGALHGRVRSGAVPPGARKLAEWTSPTLPEIVRDINKYSNNVMARQLLLTLAADPMGQPATPDQGARVIAGWLANKKIEAPEVVIENGSGLSRRERISARTLGKVLLEMWRSPWMPEFMSSLPIAGLDGTMRHRLKAAGVAGRAHIKTGGLRDVRAIAGYVLAASGRRYVVVFMINHENAGYGREAQDALLQWLHDNG